MTAGHDGAGRSRMNMRLDGMLGSQVGPRGDDRLGGMTQQQGSWRGETVSVQKSAASLLADAAEEMTFAQAEREEEKEISERRVHTPGVTNIPQIQEIQEYLEQMGEESDQAKLEELASKLAGAGGQGARELAAGAFGDVSKQFLALGHALRHFEGEGGDPEVAERLREAIEDLHEDRGPEIRAGLNTVAAAKAFAESDPGKGDSFRECYRETVLGRESLGATFTSILQRFGAKDVGRSIQFLTRAAGDDLSARGPSTSPAELKSLIEDLYHLEVLATALDACHEIDHTMRRDFGVTSVKVDTLMSKLVGLTGERWISGDRVAGLSRDMGISNAEANISFLTRVKSTLREFPLKVFNDPESRDKVLSAAQEALDQAIEEEEI